MKRIIASIFLSLFLIVNTAFAADLKLPFNGDAMFQDMNNSEKLPVTKLITAIDTAISPGLSAILGLLKIAGLAIAVCVPAYMGIQFIIAPPQKKAELKSGLIPYFIGLLLLIAGVPIAIYIIIYIFIKIF